MKPEAGDERQATSPLDTQLPLIYTFCVVDDSCANPESKRSRHGMQANFEINL